jgi:hypothetical protein
MKVAFKLDANGLVGNAIVVDEYIPDGYSIADFPVKIGESPEVTKYNFLLLEAVSSRQEAYRTEADPLYFKWQAGEGTEADWLAKRQEIRDRYPYPAE